jgi:hypothetical protein
MTPYLQAIPEAPADEALRLVYADWIASKLKGVGYLSGYNPLRDPDVLCHLRAIRGRAQGENAEFRYTWP